MKIVETVAEMQRLSRNWHAQGHGVGFVPTMGALHAGHMSLVEAARRPGDRVVASIFVNPLQFAAGEDLATYPRPFEVDLRMLEAAGVDALFHPSVEEMYPLGADTRVSPGAVSLPLEGERRPGHFAGVATVVARLLNATLPDRAYLGRKDAQQLAVIRDMVRDLAFPVEVIGCPIVREPDGLAMSSRNGYLEAVDRGPALAMVRSLARAQVMARAGETDVAVLTAAMSDEFAAWPVVALDYAAIVDRRDFTPAAVVDENSLALVAARVGRARLIDNAALLDDDVVAYLIGVAATKAAPLMEGVSAWNA